MSGIQVWPLVYHDAYGQRAGAISYCFIVRYDKPVSGDYARRPPSWTGPAVPNEHSVLEQVELLMIRNLQGHASVKFEQRWMPKKIEGQTDEKAPKVFAANGHFR